MLDCNFSFVKNIVEKTLSNVTIEFSKPLIILYLAFFNYACILFPLLLNFYISLFTHCGVGILVYSKNELEKIYCQESESYSVQSAPSLRISIIYSRISTFRQQQEGKKRFGSDNPYQITKEYSSGLMEFKKTRSMIHDKIDVSICVKSWVKFIRS